MCFSNASRDRCRMPNTEPWNHFSVLPATPIAGNDQKQKLQPVEIWAFARELFEVIPEPPCHPCRVRGEGKTHPPPTEVQPGDNRGHFSVDICAHRVQRCPSTTQPAVTSDYVQKHNACATKRKDRPRPDTPRHARRVGHVFSP